METPDFEHVRVYFKQFGAERVKGYKTVSKVFIIVLSVTSNNL